VSVNDSIAVLIRTIDLVSSLSWMVTHYGVIVSRGNVSIASNEITFRFLTLKPGKSTFAFIREEYLTSGFCEITIRNFRIDSFNNELIHLNDLIHSTI